MNKKHTRAARVVSLAMMIIWSIMGTGTSLAWFTDTNEEVKNIFHFADFELEVEYRTEEDEWETIEGETKIFDDEALYEPGYTQVVYLRVTNKGDVPFDFKTAATVTDYTAPTNVFGQRFLLQEYLRSGLTNLVATWEKVVELVETRGLAKEYATIPLGTHEKELTDTRIVC